MLQTVSENHEAPPAPQVFKASKYWESNVWGATVAGIGGALVLIAVGGILLVESAGPDGRRLGAALLLTIVATFLAMFPGNMILAVPLAVVLEPGKGLQLQAPLRRLYIPIQEIEEVRDSTVRQIFQQGVVVKLNKRHGLLKSFVIHWAFGAEGRQLARALRDQFSSQTG